MIRLAIVAPTLAQRAGLRALLSAEDIDVLVDAASIPALEVDSPDVLVLVDDPALPLDMDSLPGDDWTPAALLLSDDPAALGDFSAIPLRAWGLLPLDASEEELLAAVRALHEGLVVAAPNLLQPQLTRPLLGGSPPDELVEELTERETQVLERLAHGLANKQIALALGISEHTVKFHVSSIYTKLGVANRTEAVALGARLGLITL